MQTKLPVRRLVGLIALIALLIAIPATDSCAWAILVPVWITFELLVIAQVPLDRERVLIPASPLLRALPCRAPPLP